MANVYTLESGTTGTVNENRDIWFSAHPYFVIKKDEKNQLAFISLDAFMADKIKPTDCWVTTPAELKEHSEDNKYQLYETKSGTRYHLWLAGSISRN